MKIRISERVRDAITGPVDRLFRALDERIDDGPVLQRVDEGAVHVSSTPALGLATA